VRREAVQTAPALACLLRQTAGAIVSITARDLPRFTMLPSALLMPESPAKG
jgi:hypothetical protein